MLSQADKVFLLPIYPAREEPIEGVSSEMLLKQMTVPARVVQKSELLEVLRRENPEALITFGGGDIDRFCEPIARMFADAGCRNRCVERPNGEKIG